MRAIRRTTYPNLLITQTQSFIRITHERIMNSTDRGYIDFASLFESFSHCNNIARNKQCIIRRFIRKLRKCHITHAGC